MIAPEILDALLETGASAETIVAAVKAAQHATDTRIEARRARDAERQRRRRAASRRVRVTPRDGADLPPNEIISNPLSLPLSSDEDRPPPSRSDLAALQDRVVAAWNDAPAKAGAMACRGLNPRRKTALAARLREHGEPALFEAIANLAASPFHCGRNDRGWRASLGWLLTHAENFQSLLELGPGPQAPSLSAAERAATLERSAEGFERIGRAEDAAAMRRTAAEIRAALPAKDQPRNGGSYGTSETR